ncbi:hypothetical protein BBJ28_00000190 [Nothophytophthora sp. Chile5]|nr:hypothetical protein BBJ28_00000190 [Nothophytophthora sp. Chile5]
MGNRGRRRANRLVAYKEDPTAADRAKEQQPQLEEDPDASDRSEAGVQPEILSIRWKKPRGAAVIRYSDGSRYEGKVDDEDRRHGFGVHVVRAGHVFEGGWVHGAFEGFGSQTFAGTGDCHEGIYRKNHRHGVGTYLWSNGDKYVGNWRLGKVVSMAMLKWCHASAVAGVLTSSCLCFRFPSQMHGKGEWKKGMMHGKGKKIFASGEVIDGAWRKSQASGWGTKIFLSGDKYEGFFVKDEREGFGKYEWVNGDTHEGTWHRGVMHGKGVYLSASGSLHGTWLDGALNGQGVHRFRCGSVYTGAYKRNEKNGLGTLTFASGDVYEGDWLSGKIQGYGSWSSPDGRTFIGSWVDGRPSGNGIFCREHEERREEEDDDDEDEDGAVAETRLQFESGVFKRGVLRTAGESFTVEKLVVPS